MEGDFAWSAPSFSEPFQAVKLQQGNDAQFVATIQGNPQPEVRFRFNKASLRFVEFSWNLLLRCVTFTVNWFRLRGKTCFTRMLFRKSSYEKYKILSGKINEAFRDVPMDKYLGQRILCPNFTKDMFYINRFIESVPDGHGKANLWSAPKNSKPCTTKSPVGSP